jgi:hypothetical protein
VGVGKWTRAIFDVNVIKDIMIMDLLERRAPEKKGLEKTKRGFKER